MASIDGLTEAQCQILAPAQVGDVVLIYNHPKRQVNYGGDSGSEPESEAGQEDEQGEEVDGEEAQSEPGDEEADEESEPEPSEGEEENVDEDEIPSEAESEPEAAPTTKLYLIHHLSTDEDGIITDITLRELTYCLKPGDATSSSFHIYGRKVKVYPTTTKSTTDAEDDDQLVNISDITNPKTCTDPTLKPNGSDLRRYLFANRCPANCTDGWLTTQEEMHPLVTDTLRLVSPYHPVCPVCIGKTLMKRLQALRENFEDSYQADIISSVVDFYFDLNPRRKSLGYSFKQFDEREWGLEFHDMLSEDEDENGPNGDHWQQWDEAHDPNANPNFQGAEDTAIAALPEKIFGEVQGAEETKCAVCTETFVEQTMVTELPCGHYFDIACAQMWLKTSNSCPTCRKKIPAAEEEGVGSEEMLLGGEDVAIGDALVEDAGETLIENGNEEVSGVDEAESGQADMDGEDTIVSDVD